VFPPAGPLLLLPLRCEELTREPRLPNSDDDDVDHDENADVRVADRDEEIDRNMIGTNSKARSK